MCDSNVFASSAASRSCLEGFDLGGLSVGFLNGPAPHGFAMVPWVDLACSFLSRSEGMPDSLRRSGGRPFEGDPSAVVKEICFGAGLLPFLALSVFAAGLGCSLLSGLSSRGLLLDA